MELRAGIFFCDGEMFDRAAEFSLTHHEFVGLHAAIVGDPGDNASALCAREDEFMDHSSVPIGAKLNGQDLGNHIRIFPSQERLRLNTPEMYCRPSAAVYLSPLKQTNSHGCTLQTTSIS
jgi:hypothetical protein